MILSGSLAPLALGLGVGLVLHGHPWGGLLIAGGLGTSMPYLIAMPYHVKRIARQGGVR